ncbi:MAG: peptidoglycan DL-endopeptidase RipB [Baekduia sp.]|jgi:cell wall-associated NlpC family hydrolase|nr:peptidoglycan DL-endopeptidase RipB [Baekduia sp.]
MPRRLVACCLLAAALSTSVSACGGSGGSSSRLAAWSLPAPYLPPPDPATYAKAAKRAASAGAPARAPVTGAATAAAPRTATAPASGAPTDAQIAADLRQAYGGKGGDNLDQAAIDGNGLAIVPTTAPRKLVALMHAANDVARKPYVYGGGHGRTAGEIWTDSAYDCSGSVSYALAAAGYLNGPETSGALMSFGKPGPGKWVTIYANGGHTFMVVAGLRFDTSGRQVTGTRWQSAGARSYSGFTVRHPVGL